MPSDIQSAELALHGGPPIRTSPLPTFIEAAGRTLGDEEVAALERVVRTGMMSGTSGTEVAALEREFAEFMGARYTVTCSSGTAALNLAVAAVNLEPGDEIITPPISDFGTILRHPEVVQAVTRIANAARGMDVPWWTSAEIDDWQRRRRQVRSSVTQNGAGWQVDVCAEQPIPGCEFLLDLPARPPDDHLLGDRSGTARTVVRRRRDRLLVLVDVPSKRSSFRIDKGGQR